MHLLGISIEPFDDSLAAWLPSRALPQPFWRYTENTLKLIGEASSYVALYFRETIVDLKESIVMGS